MSLTLHVDAPRWRAHVREFVAAEGVTVVPVTKGNGYGFGNEVLAGEAETLGAPALGIGTYAEVPSVLETFTRDVVVLEPWRPSTPALPADRVIHTVSHLDDLQKLAASGEQPRVVVEVLTSMRRHGIAPDELSEAAQSLPHVRFEGFSLHLPLSGEHGDEVRTSGAQALAAAEAAGAPIRRLWVSHLTPVAAAAIAESLNAEVRLRVATALWLGERGALQARAAVLDAHAVRRGERYGYRQRRAQSAGTLLVVGGGTAHGIALQAPTPATSARQRAMSLAKGGLEAVGRAMSPFRVAGKQRWFAEPPHMQCSMLWLPGDVDPPARGSEVDVEVRFTTTTFDAIAWHD